MRNIRFSLGLIALVTSIAFSGCGTKKDPKKTNAPTEKDKKDTVDETSPKEPTSGGSYQEGGGSNPTDKTNGGSSGNGGGDSSSSAATGDGDTVSFTGPTQPGTLFKGDIKEKKLVWDDPSGKCALFSVMPNAKGLSILSMELDGNPLSNKLDGFEAAYIKTGSVNLKDAMTMCKGNTAITDTLRTMFANMFAGSLYVFTEGYKFNFKGPHTLKISVGKGTEIIDEHEFLINQ